MPSYLSVAVVVIAVVVVVESGDLSSGDGASIAAELHSSKIWGV